MKSLFINRILKRNAKIKAEAEMDKKKIAQNKNQIKTEQQKEVVTENITVTKETKTIMID